jgi:DNA-binding SARP family transcriptional activator
VEERIRLRLLGPVSLEGRDGALRLDGPQLRLLLGLFALSPGQVVPVADLVDALWEQSPPPSARASVQILVTRLRKVLAEVPGCVLHRYGDAYRLQMSPDTVDAHQFRSLAALARQARDNDEAIAILGQALRLWQGPALADVAMTAKVEAIRAGLAEEHLSAVQDRFDRLLAAGRHSQAAAEIPLMLARHPLAEQLAATLMLAWYRCGRQADALQVFRDMRARLADELAVEPGADLQHLHQRILSGDPALLEGHQLEGNNGATVAVASGHREPGTGPVPELSRHMQKIWLNGQPGSPPGNGDGHLHGHGHPAVPSSPVVPRQLPAAAGDFAGRQRELASLTELLDDGADGWPVIVTVSGAPGIGKTALALHWAHQVQQRFPDGQLYVNLRGFDSTPAPVPPGEAIDALLESIGVAASQIPARGDSRAAMYRSLLAGKRLLVVLDNARDEAQVRPLLPGSAGCLVLVTSRTELAGLVAAEGARPVRLDVLTEPEARQLLVGRLGARRVTAEPDAAAELASMCGHLPLALAIAAARAATRPALPLAALVDELRGTRHRLDALDVGDEATNIKAVFSWSYRLLSEPAARMFRLLAAHPGPDVSAAAAAAIAAGPAQQARAALAELARASLAQEQAPGRFSLHDLLCNYAAQLADKAEYNSAARRALDYYLHTAHAAMGLVYPAQRHPHHQRVAVEPLGSDSAPESFADAGQAWEWLQAEHQALVAACAAAADGGHDDLAWRLAAVVGPHFAHRGHYADLERSQRTSLMAADRLGDDALRAAALRSLGDALADLGSLEEARGHLHDALRLYRKLGDQYGQAHCHTGLSRVAESQGDYAQSLQHSQHALRLFRALADLAGEARALNAVGWDNALLGNTGRALSYCTRALRLHRDAGDRNGEAVTLDSLGFSHHQAGRHGLAVEFYRQALDAYTDTGHRYFRAQTLIHLADAHAANGTPQDARDCWQQAAEILDALGHPDARSAWARLADAAVTPS